MVINGNICKILLNKGLNGKFKSPFHFYNVKFKTSSDWRRRMVYQVRLDIPDDAELPSFKRTLDV